jgi:hypothetical protein
VSHVLQTNISNASERLICTVPAVRGSQTAKAKRMRLLWLNLKNAFVMEKNAKATKYFPLWAEY